MNERKKILIADDDAAIVDATSLILEMAGYEVVFTYDGNNVVPLLSEQRPDLLLLDIWMSGSDGRDVCRDVKANNITSTLPVLMISASKDIRESALACGANDFLEKPFEMDTLLNKIKFLLP